MTVLEESIMTPPPYPYVAVFPKIEEDVIVTVPDET